VRSETMDLIAKAILRRILDRVDSGAGFAGSPAGYGNVGGGLMSRTATAGILRLALRWPALTLILVLSVVAARVMAGRRHQPNNIPPIVRAP
jgi:hypothetical protein